MGAGRLFLIGLVSGRRSGTQKRSAARILGLALRAGMLKTLIGSTTVLTLALITGAGAARAQTVSCPLTVGQTSTSSTQYICRGSGCSSPYSNNSPVSVTVNRMVATDVVTFSFTNTDPDQASVTFSSSGDTRPSPNIVNLSSGNSQSATRTTNAADADFNATYNFTATITNNDRGTFTVSCQAVGGRPTITLSPSSLTAGAVGTAYSQTITASGGSASYTFAVTAGSLPAGLSLASGGGLTGAPTATGTFNFTVTATGTPTASKAAAPTR